jgi:HEAT repeat protein
MARSTARSGPAFRVAFLRGVHMGTLLLPALLLLIGSLRLDGGANVMLWLGTAFQLLVCTLSLLSRQGRREPIGPSVITLYIIALGWMWLGTLGSDDWYPHFAQAVLLVMPLLVFALQILTESGAPAIRRARYLAAALASRRDWPSDLAACRTLPEVKAFRESLSVGATPALALLNNKRVEVRLAALSALEFRQNWEAGQPEIVLQLALRAEEPLVRAAAITALGNVNDRAVVEALAEFLRDPSWEVRRAATEALLWDTEHRWQWLRHAARRALGDPAHQDDGPLRHDGQPLTPDAVADLTAWAAEKGVVGIRAALTLGSHYARALGECPSRNLIDDLRRQLANPHAPPPLRIELARLLRSHGELDPDVLGKLLDPSNPAPLRLTAVEALLAEGEYPEARAALHDLARLPNREIALATAELVQRRLGVDMGLVPGQPLPPIHSRQAAEVTRRVIRWASSNDLNEDEGAIAQALLPTSDD